VKPKPLNLLKFHVLKNNSNIYLENVTILSFLAYIYITIKTKNGFDELGIVIWVDYGKYFKVYLKSQYNG
jgi:regulation of enolase protein 1 (concanavalin A-like superfamily)